MNQMMFLLTVLSPLTLCGQQVKKVVTVYPKSDYVKEVYYVLRTDKNIKHGDYYSFYKGELKEKELKRKDLAHDAIGFKEKGTYKNNLKDGAWVLFKAPRENEHSRTFNVKLEEGKYADGKKTGIWNTYIDDGKVIKQFDFDVNQELPALVSVRWKYPALAKKNAVEGVVTIKIAYHNCEPIDYRIVADIGYGCGDAVIESLKEKRMLEKRYGVNSNTCDKTEEIIDVKFKLNQ